MVLSHSKLKRKRKDEVTVVVESGGAIPETSPSVVAAPDAAGEGTKKKTVKKNKKQKTNDVGGVEVGVELAVSNGAVEAEEVQVAKEVQISKEDKIKQKKEKKEEKKRRKAAEREAAGFQILSSAPEENGAHHVENRTDEAASNGVGKAEQPVGENGTTAASIEKPMSVREKKGKKNKGAKDRWGVKIANEDHGEEIPVHPVEPVAVRETPATSTSAAEELYDLKKVFVGGMPYYCTEDDIHDYFSECGIISELDCMTFPDTGNFRGIAFITFKTEEGAAKSLDYDGADMGGRFLKIEKCKLKPRATAKDPERGEVQKTLGSTAAYIGNLSWDVTEDVIKNFFKKSYSNSKIDSIRLAFDKDTGDFKGFGHVDFGDDESLEAAIKLNQTPLLGRPMKIAYSVPPKKSLVDGGNWNGNESRSSGTCYTCGDEGHKAFLCPKKGANANDKFDSRKVAACYSCGEEGHKSFLCPKKKAT